MGRLITVIVCLCLFFNVMWAQSSATADINAIKMQTELYVYAESSSATQEEALDFAKTLLKDVIQGWLAESKVEVTAEIVAKAESNVAMIEARRGSMYRIFLYIPKSDLQAIANISSSKEIVNNHSSASDNNISKNVNIDDNQLSDFVELSDVADDSSDDSLVQVLDNENQQANVITRTPLEDQMLTITKASKIQAFIKQLQSDGKLSRFGKYADMPSDINCYIFVYDRDMNIPAYLRVNGNISVNLQTGEFDDIKNYKGCGAIWFKLKY